MAKDSFIQITRVSEKMTEETEKEILRAYKTAQKDIKKQLSDLYTKYEKDGVLTYSEMAKYNRLDGMLKDINSTVNNTSINSGNKIKKLSANVFENSYYQAGYTIEGMADAKLSFSLLHKDAIQASVENPIAGLTLSETLQKNRKQVITSIKQSVTQGLVMGESYKKMADRMTSALNNDATKALRVARTEAHRNQNAGTLKAVDHAVGRGVSLKKEWIATLDDRTRDTHASMDGQVVDSDKNFVSPSGARGPAPGMLGVASEDINCRCALGTILPGADETTNRQTYEEWAESRNIPVPNEVKQIQKQTAKEIKDDLIIEDWANKTAESIYLKASNNVDGISDIIKTISNDTSTKLEGYEHRLKTKESIKRKLKGEYLENPGMSLKEVEQSIYDSIRYTYNINNLNYTKDVQIIYNKLIEKGLTPIRYRNYWDNPTYKGLHFNFKDKTGQIIEIQMHTPQSILVKEQKSHKIYEVMRVNKNNEIIQKESVEKLKDIWKNVDTPMGAKELIFKLN